MFCRDPPRWDTQLIMEVLAVSDIDRQALGDGPNEKARQHCSGRELMGGERNCALAGVTIAAIGYLPVGALVL